MRNIRTVDFDLTIINVGPERYQVTCRTQRGGIVSELFEWKWVNDIDFIDKLDRIRNSEYELKEPHFREIGKFLFDSLFQSNVFKMYYSIYRERIQAVAGSHMRIRLDIHETAPEIATIPWEFMVFEDNFISTDVKTLLTRNYLDSSIGRVVTLKVDKPRILIVIPNVDDISTDSEERAITDALKGIDIDFDPFRDIIKGRVCVGQVEDALFRYNYNILHFVGHGIFDDKTRVGALRFNALDEDDDEDDEYWLTDSQIYTLFRNHKDWLRLVVLNACRGAQVSGADSSTGFFGITPKILRAGVPSVVAMQYDIRDSVAIVFASAFYKNLTQGPWAGRIDIALTLARNACQMRFPDDRGFATPVLYLRSDNAEIFRLDPSKPQRITDCVEPNRPSESFLSRYSKVSTKDLLTLTAAQRNNLSIIYDEIETAESVIREAAERPDTIGKGLPDVDIQLMQSKRRDGEEELAGITSVLVWRLFEACMERSKVSKALTEQRQQVASPEHVGKSSPSVLLRRIAELGHQLDTLNDLLRRGQEYYRTSSND